MAAAQNIGARSQLYSFVMLFGSGKMRLTHRSPFNTMLDAAQILLLLLLLFSLFASGNFAPQPIRPEYSNKAPNGLQFRTKPKTQNDEAV